MIPMRIREFVQLFVIACACILFSGVFDGCSSEEKQRERIREELILKKGRLKRLSKVDALPEKVLSPADNPITSEKVELGRLLFYDPILSGNKDVACVTCHHPSHAYAEFRDLSVGVNGVGLGSKRAFKTPNDIPFTKRNSHTVLNTAFNGMDRFGNYNPQNAPMFWDGRVSSLEAQAIEPLKALEEMRGHDFTEESILTEITSRLNGIPAYLQLFQDAFHTEDAVTIENLGKAIAAFERTLVTNNSRFDAYKRGDEDAISQSEKHGLELFIDVGCAFCHNGPMFSDYQMHVLGVPENPKLLEGDKGFEDSHGFRTASLRNLRFTAPYMHNGSLQTLQQVLEFYEDISQRKVRNENVPPDQFDPLIKELQLSVKQMAPIISFLNTLNNDDFDKTIPESVPSGLPVGGNIAG